MSIQVQVLGGGCDVGRSCVVVKLEDDLRVMFDCGAHPGYGDERRFPNFDSIPDLAKLSCVLITHFHLDHAAALPYFTEKLGVNIPVYMTAPTADLGRLMLFDFLRTSRARNQHCPYSEEDIHASMGKVKFIDLESPLTLPEVPNLTVTAHYAGHTFGAVMFTVESKEHSVIYSGDYTTTPDRLLRAASVPAYRRPQLFITESTYCNTTRKGGRRKEEESLMEAIKTAISAGGRVLMAVPALGTAQEALATLSSHWAAYALDDTPVYIPEGLTSRANTVYEMNKEWCESGAEISGDSIGTIHAFNRNQHWHVVEGVEPCILFATPGNLSTGLSLDVFRKWCGDERNLVVTPGFSFDNTLSSQIVDDATVEMKCKTHNMPFSGHADAYGIRKIIRTLRPDAVMLMHGDKKKMEAFKIVLSNDFRIPVFCPESGQTIKVMTNEIPTKAWLNDDEIFRVNPTVPRVMKYINSPFAALRGYAGMGYEERRVQNFDAVLSEIQEKLGELKQVGPGEYKLEELFVSQVQDEDSYDLLVVEWTKPRFREQALRLLNIVDRATNSTNISTPAMSPAA